jgi:hypothetical protein
MTDLGRLTDRPDLALAGVLVLALALVVAAFVARLTDVGDEVSARLDALSTGQGTEGYAAAEGVDDGPGAGFVGALRAALPPEMSFYAQMCARLQLDPLEGR